MENLIGMFHQARIKLTLWYLLIIMLVSSAFSLVVYRSLTYELDRVQRLQELRWERMEDGVYPGMPMPLPGRLRILMIDPEVIKETKNRIIINLLGINAGILGLSGFAGYMLAGRTLRPIKEMTDGQDRFIADASHELRTPLTALRTELEVALMNKRLALSEAKNLLESNLEEVIKLQALSDRLLVLTRQAKGNNLKKEKVVLRNVIDGALRNVQPVMKSKQIVLEDNLTDYAVIGEEEHYVELFTILLDNAAKYSHKGGKVTLTSDAAGSIVKVAVSDNGIGIRSKDLPHIFERFYRADISRSKAKTEGFGLGLSIAKEIADLYGAGITVKSKVSKGSVFTISMPLAK